MYKFSQKKILILTKYKSLTKKNIDFAKKKRFVEWWKFNQNRNRTFGTIV